MAKSRGRKFAELVAPTNGVFAAASIPTLAISKLASSAVTINSESLSLGGSLTLDTSDIGEHTSNKYFTDARAQATLSVASNSGHGALAYDNSNGEFTFAGITTEAIQDVVGAMFSSNTETAVTVTYEDSDGTIDLIVDDTTKVPLAGGTMTGNLTLGDNVNAYFGASTDLRIYHDGTNSHIINSTGELRVTGSNIAIKSDSAKLYLGASDDLQIYHDGSNSYIKDAGTGALRIAGSQVILRNAADSAHMLRADDGGAVGLYHNSSSKLETTSTGVTITGLATMTTGVATSKFAVASTGVHGSYDFYNNGTSYFNGAVTVDDTLSANNVSILGTGILRVGTNQTWSNAVNPSSSIRLAYDGVERSITGHYTDGMSIRTNAHILRLATDGKVHFPAFTFPASDGTNGQVLQTNGSGVLSWSTAAGGGSVFSTSGSDAYYTSGSVGIGTSSPASILHIEGSTNAYNTSPLLYFGSTSTANAGVRDWAIGPADSAYGNFHIFRGASTGASPIGSAGTVLTIDNAGRVGLGGIGYFAPAAPLHINSATDEKVILSGSADPYIRWQEGSTNKAYIQWNAAGYLAIGNSEDGSHLKLDSALIVTPAGDEAIVLQGRNDPYIRFQEQTTNKAYIQWNAAGYLEIRNQEDGSGFRIKDALDFSLDGSTYHTVWHAGNDGASSGLFSQYTNTLVGTGGINNAVSSNHIEYSGQISNGTTGLFNASNNANGILRINTHSGDYYHDLGFSSDGSMYHRRFTNSNAFTTLAWNKVWTASNDGSGSGLDADTLDGQQGSYYLDTGSSYQRKAAGIQLGSSSSLTSSSSQLALAGNNPYISFHHGSAARTAYIQEASSRFYFGECTYTETEGSFRAPIFYDVNNTSYYTDQANVSRFNNIRPDTVSTPGSGTATMFVFGKNTGAPDHINLGGSSGDPAGQTNTVGLSWGTRTDGNGYYLIGLHNYNNGYSTHSRLRIGWHTGLELGGNATYGGVRIFEDSPYVNSTEQARFRGSAGIVFSRTFTDTVDIRAPIYYDNGNTAYFLDPGASGTALRTNGSWRQESTSWTGEIAGKIQYHGNHWYFQSTNGTFHFRNSSGTNGFYGDTSFNIFSNSSFRAPIFYDSGNTGYYCDPAGTSNLNAVTTNSTLAINSTVQQQDNQAFIQEGYFRTSTSAQNTNGSANAYSFGYQVAGAWSHPYPDLILGFHTGIRIGGHKNYHGTRFYNDHPDKGASPSEIFSVGKSDDHVRATNNIYAYTSDKRLKENFRPIENAVDKVKALGGFIFDWRKDMMDKHSFAPDQEKDDAGLIAQEVQKVMPAAIRRAPFDYDPDKPNHSKSGEEFMTVQYEKMVPLLIEAIKEQQEQIDQLKKLLEEKE